MANTMTNSSTQSFGIDGKPRNSVIWDSLKTFVNKWYYKPDIDCIAIALSLYASHGQKNKEYLEEPPIWLFISGASSAGKTSLCIDPMVGMEGTYLISDITPSGFLSGMKSGQGILQKLSKENEGNGVLLFPDFTVLLNKNPNDRDEIIGQMRRIYDGRFERTFGSNATVRWRGKITVLAATTPEIERKWSVQSALGERFLTVRYRIPSVYSEEASKLMEYAAKQMGREAEIKKGVSKRVKMILSNLEGLKPIDVSGNLQKFGIFALGRLLSVMRTQVSRDMYRQTILGRAESEGPMRIIKALGALLRGWLTIIQRDTPLPEDLKLVKRVVVDSIPTNRWIIIKTMMKHYLRGEIPIHKLLAFTGITKTMFYQTLGDLELLGVIEIYKDKEDGEKVVKLENLSQDVLSDEEEMELYKMELSNLGMSKGRKRYKKVRFSKWVDVLLEESGLIYDYCKDLKKSSMLGVVRGEDEKMVGEEDSEYLIIENEKVHVRLEDER